MGLAVLINPGNPGLQMASRRLPVFRSDMERRSEGQESEIHTNRKILPQIDADER